jgi:hypothetical protein
MRGEVPWLALWTCNVTARRRLFQLATGEKEWSEKPTLSGWDEESSSPSMRKSFNYRLHPTKRQQRLLSEHLEEVRWLGNTVLAERKQAWEERQATVD